MSEQTAHALDFKVGQSVMLNGKEYRVQSHPSGSARREGGRYYDEMVTLELRSVTTVENPIVVDSTKLTLEQILEALDGAGLIVTDWNEVANTLISNYNLEITQVVLPS